ncbi:hypothetical protein FRB95_001360 [Tulasnella sp. JGI-2019a]|nr:hypothetical protein FRB95_001360 [Tulasnella sp. JGI-2019a]
MSIRSRVRAFEEAAAASEKYQKPLVSPRTSLTFSSDDGVTSSSAPASPIANSVLDDLDSFVLTGTPPSTSPSPTSFSPSSTAHAKSATGTAPNRSYPLISFASPPRSVQSHTPIARKEQNGIGLGAPPSATMMPPLPPRRQTSTSSLGPTTIVNNKSGVATPALPPRSSPKPPSFNGLASSDSLTIDYPFTIISTSKPSYAPRHAHASSSSSFHSLSLSDGGDKDGQHDETNVGKPMQKAAAYGAVGIGAAPVARKAAPPIPDRPGRQVSSNTPAPTGPLASVGPPPIPQKPASIASSSSQQPPYQVRRQPPPAPPRPSNSATNNTSRKPAPPLLDLTSSTSSLTSTGTTSYQQHQNLATRRRTPCPLPARLRYEELFDHQRKLPSSIALLSPLSSTPGSRRTHTGWRGTSIDLRPSPSPDPAGGVSPSEVPDKLHGQVVQRIWLCSKLDKKVLRDIWSECDQGKTGALDRSSFVQGMWRIDEELAKKAAAAASRRRTIVSHKPQTPYAVRR